MTGIRCEGKDRGMEDKADPGSHWFIPVACLFHT